GGIWPFVSNDGSYTNPQAENVIFLGINDNGLVVGANENATANPNAPNDVGFVYDTSTQSFSYLQGPSQIIPVGINDRAEIVVTPVLVSGYAGILTPAVKPILPKVTSITATTDSGLKEINAGHVVTISVTTNEVVNVTGTPSLQLNDNEVASYVGGTG